MNHVVLHGKIHNNLKRICLKTLVFPCLKNEEVQYFQEISTKIKNQDFDEVCSSLLH